ncbi:hypothetical protein GCM10010466_06130 [Planomonospora alba]|uniref:Uncharacterized protein n=2 Tax=Planomonospora alba TaxID=161354 RepID=A0ABP6MKY4_9ACTN
MSRLLPYGTAGGGSRAYGGGMEHGERDWRRLPERIAPEEMVGGVPVEEVPDTAFVEDLRFKEWLRGPASG